MSHEDPVLVARRVLQRWPSLEFDVHDPAVDVRVAIELQVQQRILSYASGGTDAAEVQASAADVPMAWLEETTAAVVRRLHVHLDITELDFRDLRPEEEDRLFHRFHGARSLGTLAVEFSEGSLRSFARGLRSYVHLQKLSFWGHAQFSPAWVPILAEALQSSVNLVELTLMLPQPMDGAGAESMGAALGHLQAMRTLRLREGTEELWARLPEWLPLLPRLGSIYLGGSERTTPPRFLQAFKIAYLRLVDAHPYPLPRLHEFRSRGLRLVSERGSHDVLQLTSEDHDQIDEGEWIARQAWPEWIGEHLYRQRNRNAGVLQVVKERSRLRYLVLGWMLQGRGVASSLPKELWARILELWGGGRVRLGSRGGREAVPRVGLRA